MRASQLCKCFFAFLPMKMPIPELGMIPVSGLIPDLVKKYLDRAEKIK